MSEESQVIGQITSDVFTSPFTYSLSLPIEPQASLRDVDQDGEIDEGVMVYAVAYWTNTWGDALPRASATCRAAVGRRRMPPLASIPIPRRRAR